MKVGHRSFCFGVYTHSAKHAADGQAQQKRLRISQASLRIKHSHGQTRSTHDSLALGQSLSRAQTPTNRSAHDALALAPRCRSPCRQRHFSVWQAAHAPLTPFPLVIMALSRLAADLLSMAGPVGAGSVEAAAWEQRGAAGKRLSGVHRREQAAQVGRLGGWAKGCARCAGASWLHR